MKTMLSLLMLVTVLFAAPAFAADPIVGTWKLVSVVYEDVATKERTPVLGEHPKGIQIATPEGRWLALVTAEGQMRTSDSGQLPDRPSCCRPGAARCAPR